MTTATATSGISRIEEYLDARVHLSLWVKVKKNWRDDTSLLRLIGLPVA